MTVKHDKSIKLAFHPKLLKDAINKNENKLQSIGNLMDAVAKYISDNKQYTGESFLER